MTARTSRVLWITIGVFSILISLYPAIYLTADWSKIGLTASKGSLIHDFWWKTAFYAHIIGGAITLIAGWLQFSSKIRKNKPKLHRAIGIVYVIIVCLFGATSGLYLAYYANGGFLNSMGFGLLAVLWLFTTVMALRTARAKKYNMHKNWMIRSYALNYAAVTLRLWLPLLTFVLDYNHVLAYAIVAWICWVPNLIFSEIVIVKKWVI